MDRFAKRGLLLIVALSACSGEASPQARPQVTASNRVPQEVASSSLPSLSEPSTDALSEETSDETEVVTNTETSLSTIVRPEPTRSEENTSSASCGYMDSGSVLEVTAKIELCLPKTACTSETCPPPLGTCVDNVCEFEPGYDGLRTLPEAWATHYCDLATQDCHGVSQLKFPEETAQEVGRANNLPLCGEAEAGASSCVGIAASSPMLVGNSEVAVKHGTDDIVVDWGLGLTEASGLCYEIEGPGGTAIVAMTDRCAGYCSCAGSGPQECGPCVNAQDMEPNCACVGAVPGMYSDCCGVGCGVVEQSCDWCASNNHPHFDLDVDAFRWVCGEEAQAGSCELDVVRYVNCLEPNPDWPQGGSGAQCKAENGMFYCMGEPPSPEQPVVSDTDCCCNWGLQPSEGGGCS